MQKKKRKRTQRSFYKVKKEHSVLFQYIFIYILYIYIYILKKERNVLRSFAKERNVLAFFYILCKRMFRSLRSFTFFAKEWDILYILFCSFEKIGKEWNVLLGLISRQKVKKRTVKNETFWTGKNAVPNPAEEVLLGLKQHFMSDKTHIFLSKQLFLKGWITSEIFLVKIWAL